MTLDVCVLGSIGASIGGVPVTMTSANQRRLLGILTARHGCTVSRDLLADTLGVSIGGVRTAVSRLRSAIGADHIACNPPGYALMDCQVDSAVAEQLASEAAMTIPDESLVLLGDARALWFDEPFVEFEAEEWAMAEAMRLRGLRSHIEEEWIDALIACEHFDQAIDALEAHIPTHPFRERPRRALMVALARSGRRVEAIRAYQGYRAFLIEEMGLEPSDKLHELERMIVTGEHEREQQGAILEVGAEIGSFSARCDPGGRQTFLFTDATCEEDLWHQTAVVITRSLKIHDLIVSRSIELHGGKTFVDAGGSFGAVFEHTDDAVSAAIDCRAELRAADWRGGPILGLRVGVDVGMALRTQQACFDTSANTASGVCEAANDGQILVTGDVADGTNYMVRALGFHLLDRIKKPVDIWQVGSEEPRLITDKPRPRAMLQELALPAESVLLASSQPAAVGSASPTDASVSSPDAHVGSSMIDRRRVRHGKNPVVPATADA